MRRRALLAVVGSGLVGLSGCSSTNPASDTATSTAPPVETSPGTTPPPSPDDRPDETDVALEITFETVRLVEGYAEEVQFVLHNNSEERIRVNPHSWRFWSWTGGGWHQWERRFAGDGFIDVRAGESHPWSFEAAYGAVGHEPPAVPGWYAAQFTAVPTAPVRFRLVEY